MGQRLVERGHLVDRRPLLRPEDRRGAVIPEEGIPHVGGQHHRHVSKPRVKSRHVHRGESREVAPAVGDVGAGRVAQPNAQRRQHAGAAVGAGAATDREHQVPGPRIEGGSRPPPQPATRGRQGWSTRSAA
jgi:hypothetical protein